MDLNTITTVVPATDRSVQRDWRPGDAWLAGGTWLFSEPQPDLRRLVDLRGFGWPALQATPAGLEIAATCTLAELARYGAEAASGWAAAPLIGQCCHALLGSFKVWNEATVGGNLCMALPAGPMTSLCSALDGVCTIWTPDGGEHTIPVVDFVTGAGRNVLRPGELLRSVWLPAAALRRDSRSAYRSTAARELAKTRLSLSRRVRNRWSAISTGCWSGSGRTR